MKVGLALSTAEQRALRWAAQWTIDPGDGGFLDDWMKEHGCGRTWHAALRRAIEKLSRRTA